MAIDAGHGGKDPGAIGKKLGIKEKDVTLAIAKELKALLDADPNFKAVMTRKTDTFVQLPRSEQKLPVKIVQIIWFQFMPTPRLALMI